MSDNAETKAQRKDREETEALTVRLAEMVNARLPDGLGFVLALVPTQPGKHLTWISDLSLDGVRQALDLTRAKIDRDEANARIVSVRSEGES